MVLLSWQSMQVTPMLLELGRNLGVHFQVGVFEVVHPHLLLQLGGIRGLAGEADAAGLQPGGVDLQLVDEHVVMAPGLVVFHAEPPAVEQAGPCKGYSLSLSNLSPSVSSPSVFADPGGLGSLLLSQESYSRG